MVARHGAEELVIPMLLIWGVVQDTGDLFLNLSCREGRYAGHLAPSLVFYGLV